MRFLEKHLLKLKKKQLSLQLKKIKGLLKQCVYLTSIQDFLPFKIFEEVTTLKGMKQYG